MTNWSEAELEAVLDALPARVTWWDDRMRLRYANAAAVEATGAAYGEALGRRIDEVRDAAWLTDNADSIAAVFQGEPQRLERRSSEQGEWRSSDAYLTPVWDSRGVTGFVVFAVDSTALERAQQEARNNIERAAVIGERQRIAAELGAAVVERLGATRAELVEAAAAPADRSLELRRIAGSRLDDVMASLRTTIRSLARSPASAVDDAEPTLSTQFLKASEGLTSVRAAPAGLSVEELLAVLDAIPAAVTAFDTGFYNTFANQAAVTVYRFGSRDAVHGKQGAELLGQAAYDASLPYGEAAMAGHPQQFVRTVPDPAGGTRSAQIDYVAQVVDGVAIGAVAVVVDVTSRVAAEAAARASLQELIVLGDRARIAEDLHDLVIQRLFAAGLMITSSGGDDDEKIRQAVDCISDALEELQGSIHELHGLEGTFQLESSLQRLVRQAARALGFSPTVSLDQPAPRLTTDLGVDVVAVVSEALSNAARHARPSRVDVAVHARDGELLVRVADDGPGPGVSASSRRSGLANLAARAHRRGGRFACSSNQSHGTVLEWVAPLDLVGWPRDAAAP